MVRVTAVVMAFLAAFLLVDGDMDDARVNHAPFLATLAVAGLHPSPQPAVEAGSDSGCDSVSQHTSEQPPTHPVCGLLRATRPGLTGPSPAVDGYGPQQWQTSTSLVTVSGGRPADPSPHRHSAAYLQVFLT